MRYDEFVAKVRDRGEYGDRDETERVILAVLGVLARRLDPSEVEDLAARLPERAGGALRSGQGTPEPFGAQEFLERIALVTGADEQTAEWDASAVLSTVSEAVPDGEIEDMLTGLPSRYAVLFGRPALAGD